MKSNYLQFIFSGVLILFSQLLSAQVYRASVTDALQNNGVEWVQKNCHHHWLLFSDYSGQIEIKTALSSLFIQSPDSVAIVQNASDTLADFTMTLDKEQIKQQQVSAGKTFTTTGLLIIHSISKKIPVQCQLIPRNNPSDGFSITVNIRFNPADFNMRMEGETDSDPLIVRVTSGYINRQQNSF